jgi:hypothetical protein
MLSQNGLAKAMPSPQRQWLAIAGPAVARGE